MRSGGPVKVLASATEYCRNITPNIIRRMLKLQPNCRLAMCHPYKDGRSGSKGLNLTYHLTGIAPGRRSLLLCRELDVMCNRLGLAGDRGRPFDVAGHRSRVGVPARTCLEGEKLMVDVAELRAPSAVG